MEIVLLAANEFGYKIGKKLIDWGYKISGIYTIPKKFNISYADTEVTNFLHKDFSDFREGNIPIRLVKNDFSSDPDYHHLQEWDPDLIIVAGWYYYVPERFREYPRFGTLAFHHSLLPKYRGGAPLVWALINGEDQAGTTLFYLDDGIDSGPILDQSKFVITDKDDIGSLYQKANSRAFQLLKSNIEKIGNGTDDPEPQDELKASIFPQRSPEDGLIIWNWSARRIWNFTRAQTKPYPGAFTYYNRHKITLWSSSIHNEPIGTNKPGKIHKRTEDCLLIECGDGKGIWMDDWVMNKNSSYPSWIEKYTGCNLKIFD